MIRRTSRKLPIVATQFRSWSELADDLGITRAELAEQCVFSDLHLGAWKGHWIGRELCEQLGIAFPQQQQPRIGLQARQVDEGTYIGELTDNEGRGDFNTLLAYQVATAVLERIAAKKVRWIVVIAPAAPERWGDDNAKLVEFLAQGCRDAGCELVLVYCGDGEQLARSDLQWRGGAPAAATPSGAPPSAIPGIIGRRFVAEYDLPADALVLPDGRYVHAPKSRKAPSERARDLLASFLDGEASFEYQWLAAYCFCDDVVDDDEVNLLFACVTHRSAEGGDDVVLKLLDRARTKTTNPALIGWADGQRQSAVLRLRRWAEAAAGPVPGAELDPSVRLLGHLSKAWGLVMTNRAAEAEPHFQACRDLWAHRTDSKFYLYLLNVSALNKLRLGAFDEALALEKVIERGLAAELPTDWHATYINTINQARLYKKAGDLATWEAYYTRAFSITDGLRSESDLFYTCVCYAQLEEKKDHPDEALRCWLRAAIHWLSAPVPEATAPRVVEAITFGPRTEFVEEVSQKIRSSLVAAWTKAGRDPNLVARADRSDLAAPSFERSDAGGCPRFAIGDTGWAVLVGGPPAAPRFDGIENARLAWTVWYAIGALAGTKLPETCAVVTDAQFGSDLPRTLDETLDSARRAGVTLVLYGGRPVVASERRARIGIAPGVAAVNGTIVSYKRYLKPVALTPYEAEVVRRVADETVLDAAHTAIVGELEAKRVLRVTSHA